MILMIQVYIDLKDLVLKPFRDKELLFETQHQL